MSKSREYQSLNKMFRARLHLEFQVDAYYGLNPTPQSPIGSVCVDVKGEISHATLNTMIKFTRLLLFHMGCINLIFQSKVQRSVTNNFSISEGPRISVTNKSLTNNFSNSEAPRISS